MEVSTEIYGCDQHRGVHEGECFACRVEELERVCELQREAIRIHKERPDLLVRKAYDRIEQHAEDLVNDWQAGNINEKDIAARLQVFIVEIRALKETGNGGS